jgi:group I intron endonuclease|tara:strand:+ start:7485 stop:8150 length:666 start_codon:yes stop_codon:yes gene_type:complete
MIGIYIIKNTINDKIYVGSSIDIGVRWRNHKKMLKGNYHSNNHLQNAWNKYGEECFGFLVLEVVDDENILLRKERIYMNEYNSYNRKHGYNNMIPGENKGFRHSEGTKKKMSRKAKGRVFSKKTLQNMKSASRGRRYTIEGKQKLSEARKKNYKNSNLFEVNKNQHGSSHPRAVLSEEMALEIKKKFENGVSRAKLAREYGVGWTTIARVVNNEHWTQRKD